jgi:hypothetical protein
MSQGYDLNSQTAPFEILTWLKRSFRIWEAELGPPAYTEKNSRNGSSSKPMSRHKVPPYKCTIPSLSKILGAWWSLVLLHYYLVNCICLGLIKVGKPHRWGSFPNVGLDSDIALVLGPLLFWECSHHKALKPFRKVLTLHLLSMGYFALFIPLFRNQNFSSKSWFSLPIIWP